MKPTRLFIDKIMNSRTQQELALELEVHFVTIRRWCDKEDWEKFATLKVIAAITKITGLTQDEIFEPETTKA